MKMEPLVKARKLSKLFNTFKAVDEIDFDIYQGEIVGFLGPNGAGKTTTIRMLLNLLTPTSGELTLFGKSFQQNRSDILSQMNSSSGPLTLPGKLSVFENLRVFADLYGISDVKERVHHLMTKFDLQDFRNRPLYSLSTGQQVRVSLAKAFLNRPKLLLLDEPTSNLDPDVADRVRSFLMSLVKEEGTTVFLTSHNMKEVGQICTRILFLNNGKIQIQGTPIELTRQIKRWTINMRTKNPIEKLPRVKLPPDAETRIDQHDVIIDLDESLVGPFITDLVKQGVELESISIHEPTLEDFFVQSARKHE